MAVEDYKKRRDKVRSWSKESFVTEKNRTADIKNARNVALAVEDNIRKDSIIWKGYYKHLRDINLEWEKIAVEVIKLQDELKKAQKSKDKTKFKSLEKKIDQLDKSAQKVENKFNKSFGEQIKMDQKLKKIIKAVASLPH